MPTSTLGTILADVVSKISAIGLTSIGTNVKGVKFPWRKTGDALPIVYVSPIQEQLPATGTNDQDDTVYGVQISIANISNQSNELAANSQLLEWRELIVKRFREKRSVTGAYRVIVEPGPVVDPVAWANQLDGTTLFLRCSVRATRT